MIGNISRAAFFMQCRRKYHNVFVLGQEPLAPAEPLLIGGAFHKGAAVLTAKKDRHLALAAAEEEYRERIKHAHFLPEELAIVEKNIELTRRMINAEADMYEKDDWEVLQPEVEFCVALPNTTHHCVFVHDILYPPAEGSDRSLRLAEYTVCRDERCQQPHYIRGKSDAVLSWKSMSWVLERKTSGLMGDLFWNRWYLDMQPTGYIYGIWKSIGLKPNGFIMEKVTKPRKNAADPFHITIEREPFLRSDTDLLEFERDFTGMLTDMEQAYISGNWYKNTASCFNWNRKCHFLDQCRRNHQIIEGEFRKRDQDYVDVKYYEILGLPVPTTTPTEEPRELDA